MGTDRTTASDRQAAFAELAAAVQRLRGGAHAREMAAAAFRHARGATALVGLAAGGERAVFYEGNARTVVAVPLDAHGLDHAGAERRCDRLRDPSAWVDAHGTEMAWVAPHYRWVLADEGRSG
jgi:hypothetical protein